MIHILLVEDDKNISNTISYYLQSKGFTIYTAKTVKEGIEKIKNNDYDLMLLDINLPDGTGYALYQEMENIQEIPTIFLTALDEEKDIVKGTPKSEILEIKLSDIRSNPYQPRKTFDEESLKEFSESIKEYGVIEPIIVKKTIKGYELVAGERRTRAARLAGLETIPAVVKDFNDQEMMEIALLENIQREDLNAVEEALAYSALMERFSLTQEQVAKQVGKSRSAIANIIRLLDLPEEVLEMLRSGDGSGCSV